MHAPPQPTSFGNATSPLRAPLGSCLDTLFDVVSQSPDDADVDLSVACMFEREFPGARLSGGLLRLDQALGGALTSARSSGLFRARSLDSLLVTRPPAQVRAKAILVLGLGGPETLDEETLSRACAFAVGQAERLRSRSAAFAPNLLDAGVPPSSTLHAARAMLTGALSALALSDRLRQGSLAAPSSIRTWSFDAGAAHFDAVVDDFAQTFATLSRQIALDTPAR